MLGKIFAAGILAFLALMPLDAHASPAANPAPAPAGALVASPAVTKALALYQQGKYKDGILLLNEYLSQSPGDYVALVARAVGYASEQQYDDGVRDLDAALAINAQIPKAELLKCTYLYALHRLDDAIAACTQSLRLDPQDADAYDARALALDAKDDSPHERLAVEDVNRAIEISPTAWAYAERCELKIELNEYASAGPDCDQSLQMNPSSGWTWYQRGRVALQAQDYAAAESDFSNALANHTTLKYVYVSLAQAQLGLGKYAEALENVNAYIAKYPNVGSAYLVRAKIYAKLGKPAQAISDASLALKYDKAGGENDDAAEAQAFLNGLTSPR
jgi:tetratricopeptide (TPR) repeat protein